MNKKNFFLAFGILLIVIAAMAILILNFFSGGGNDPFLSSLKGEIVFARRDGLYLNIYKINANGTEEKFLYHHENKLNSNASHPIWSEDRVKIYFTALIGDDWKNSEWKIFKMDTDGKNIKISEDKVSLPSTSSASQEKDIVVEKGSIYYVDEKKDEILVYNHKNYDYYENPGPGGISWSPDKKYLIFSLNGYITIINKEGTKMVKITKGVYPDWKY